MIHRFIQFYVWELGNVGEKLNNESFILKRNVFGDNWQVVKQKMPSLYEVFRNLSEIDKPLPNLKKSIDIHLSQVKLRMWKKH